ncbi:MAG TPA: hypothetical protein VEL31_02550 [Ktedonobacteraceae bacterium]|nr:hypothetical protein [Ktedonobacteraceae bacterium]
MAKATTTIRQSTHPVDEVLPIGQLSYRTHRGFAAHLSPHEFSR